VAVPGYESGSYFTEKNSSGKSTQQQGEVAAFHHQANKVIFLKKSLVRQCLVGVLFCSDWLWRKVGD
jgi:hypothetical protein